MKNKLKKLVGLGAGLVITSSLALAQAAAEVPDAAEFTTQITAIGGVVGAAAAIGFSVWIYRKVKAKAGQAVG